LEKLDENVFALRYVFRQMFHTIRKILQNYLAEIAGVTYSNFRGKTIRSTPGENSLRWPELRGHRSTAEDVFRTRRKIALDHHCPWAKLGRSSTLR